MLLIEGAPGIGKTVLSKEIAFQWASNELLKSIKVLLLVFLRTFHSRNINSVERFLQHIFKNSKFAKDVGDHLIKSNGKDLAIIFDGYDEISEKDRINSFVADIIKRVVFPQCLLVITSRPTASSRLHSIANCRVEIIGFTEEDRLDYINTAIQDSHEKVEALQLYLHSNPTINALCYIPLNMTILLCLSVNGLKHLPKTQTELYKRFIEMTVVRFLQKADNNLTAVTLNLYELPYPQNKVFTELSCFAFKALQNDKIVFTLAELKTSCPNLTSTHWNGLGLLKSVKYFNYGSGKEELTCHFLHFSIQEYMAAYYISKLSDNEQIKLLKTTFWTIRYYNTWIMYVGITGGESFALKHFLSGNWFQLSTWLVKSPGISKKLISDKIKCLHMFQCLAETENYELISSVGKCFCNQEIDLSDQTLLPNQLDTLGFFLIRSVRKQWRMLNLSRCNIGSIGCNSLSERLLNKNTQHLLNVQKVDFSCNQLNLESLVKLFEVLKSWNVSELIITDNAILDSTTSSKLYSEIEYNFIQSINNTTLKLACIGTFLFAYEVNHEKIKSFVSSLAANIESMYLLKCNMNLCVSEQVVFSDQRLKSIHFLGTTLHTTTASIIPCINNIVDYLLVYDFLLSDSAADEVYDVISSIKSHGIVLIISKNKIQGIINTCSLQSTLSDLEILNLILKMRSLSSNCVSTVNMWRTDLQFYSGKSENIIHCFVKFLHQNALVCQLKIKLVEENTFIAHKIGYKDMIHIITDNQFLSHIYLSSCGLNEQEYEKIANSIIIKQRLSNLVLLNMNLNLNTLCRPLLQTNELRYAFLHTTSCYLSEDDLCVAISTNHNISIVVLTKDLLIVHNPTSEQLTLAYQLEPSFTTWKLFYCKFDADTFYLILTMLTILEKVWVEVDFTGCNIGQVDYEITHEYIRTTDCKVKIKKLIVPAYQLTNTLSTLTKIAVDMDIKELVIFDCNNTFYNHLVENLQKTFISSCNQTTVVFSVLSNTRKTCFFCNTDWKEITSLLNEDITSLFIINCSVSILTKDEAIILFSKMPNLSQITLSSDVLIEVSFFEKIMDKQINLSVFINMVNQGEFLYNATERSLLNNAKYSFIAATNDAVYGYNVTQQQLLLLKSYTKLYCTHDPTTLLYKIKHKIEKEMFIVKAHQLQAICFISEVNQILDAANLACVLNKVSTLTIFGIINYTVTYESTYILRDTIINNNKLERVYLNRCFQNNDSLVAILKVLQNISTLAVLEVANNNITIKEAGDIATVLACNSELQVLNLNGNYLQATGIIRIAASLKYTYTLNKLLISNNNITEEAAGDIADVILHNPNLQEVDLSNNYFLSIGAIIIANALNTVSTLTILSLSNNNITEEATDAIAGIISCNTNLQKLCLDGSTVHMRKIAKSLRYTHTLTELCVSNNITVEGAADSIAEILHHNTQLEKLKLNGNNLQDEGIIEVSKGLQSTPHIKTLELAYNNISEEAANDLAEALSCSTQLNKLNLNGNNIQTTGIIRIMGALNKVSSLVKLYFDDNNVTESAAHSIATVLSHNPNLRVLSVNGNNLQATGILQLANGLKRISTLTELCLNNNNITEEAGNDIAALIFHNKCLQKLALDENDLQDKGIKKIAWALLYVTTLTHLCLSYNNITDHAASDIATALSYNTKLQVLKLNGNNLQAKGIIMIAKSLQHVFTLQDLEIECCNCTEEAADDIAAVLSHNTKLQVLNLNENSLQANGISVIVTALANTYTLQSLKIEGNNCTEKAANDLAVVLSHNTNIQVLNLNRNNLHSKGVIKIVKSLQNVSSLHSLSLGYNNCTEEAADDIAAVISHNTKLHALYLGGNHLQTKGAKIILKSLANILSLTKLYLEDNNITTEAADNIAAVLSCNTKLQELVLSKNNLLGEGTTKIARALQNTSSLTKFCIDNNNVTEEAADGIATVLSCNTKLKELGLGANHLHAIGTLKIARSLTCISTLTVLCINDNGINDHNEEIGNNLAAVISCNMQLRVLDLTKNFLTTRGIIKVAKALQNSKNLISLKIAYTRFCWKAADDIAAIIYNATLQELDLGGNYLRTTGIRVIAKALSNIVTLKKLYIDNTKITDEAASDIILILFNNRNLRKFVISENYLSATSIENIAIGLKHITSLTKLYISKNHISETAAHCIAVVLLQNTALEEINLNDTNLQTKNTVTVAKALSKISKLTTLLLDNNNICEEAADDIAAVIFHNTRLQTLSLSCNNLLTVGIIKIAKALQSISTLHQLGIEYNGCTEEAVDDIIAALSHNNELQQLNITGNDLQTKGTMKLARVLETLPITKLYIGHRNLTKESAKKISTILSHNMQLQLYIESMN